MRGGSLSIYNISRGRRQIDEEQQASREEISFFLFFFFPGMDR